MKPIIHLARRFRPWALLSMLLVGTLLSVSGALSPKTGPRVTIVPPNAKFNGRTYSQWTAAFWQWMLALPLQGHPATDDPSYVFGAHQSGAVWYWAAPDGPITRQVTLPFGTSLLLTIRDVETSTLEEFPFFGATEVEQRSNSVWFADHIIDLFCVIDGVPVENLQDYRFVSPQFPFNAPTPWIFGATGGSGKAVGDGYYLMLTSLSPGLHTIHYGGTFHFDAGELDTDPVDFPHEGTIQLTVSKGGRAGNEDDDSQGNK